MTGGKGMPNPPPVKQFLEILEVRFSFFYLVPVFSGNPNLAPGDTMLM
jgi:hypothetical protein